MSGLRSRMKSVLITDPSGIAEIEDAWRRLAELRSNAFVSPEWFRSWWAHQNGSCTPLIVAVHRHDGSLAGVMPLVLDTSSRPRAIRFAGASLGDCFHPAASEEDEDAVAAAAMAALEEHGIDRTMLLLENVAPGGSWWREMQEVSSLRRAAVEQQKNELVYIPLHSLDWDWDTYLAGRSKNFRRRVRRREKNLRRDHRVELRMSTASTLEAVLERFFDLHLLRWSKRGRSSLEAAGVKPVLTGFAAAAERNGWLRLSLLEIDGSAVAAFLGWRVGRVYAFYQQGFDPAWSDHSVGFVLATMMIREAMAEGADEFDFLLGTEDYKRAFSDAARLAETVVLPKATSMTRLVVSAEARARRASRWIADSHAFGDTARSLAGMLPTSRAS
jgi:CelD/BcsL family acetyltransferase involved in cellulose biosynthesis